MSPSVKMGQKILALSVPHTRLLERLNEINLTSVVTPFEELSKHQIFMLCIAWYLVLDKNKDSSIFIYLYVCIYHLLVYFYFKI